MNVYMKDNFCTIYKLKFQQLQRFLEVKGLKLVKDLNEADKAESGAGFPRCLMLDMGVGACD